MPYNPSFIRGYKIALPVITDQESIAPLLRGNKSVLDYHHHSVVMNKKRRFAWYSASNIDGSSWEPIERSGHFLKDENMDDSFQLGEELYQAIGGRGRKNDFDEGHLTSFQEVLWGDPDDCSQAGKDTFYFPNCVPQHQLLNRGAWRSLEQYITKKGADKNELAVSVFTGPVFNARDPYFIKLVRDQFIRIPCAFWKVIYYKGPLGLSAVGFMMSHHDLLFDEGTITYDKDEVEEKAFTEEDVFMSFPKATTYQVKVEMIARIAKLDFHLSGVQLPFQKNDKKEVIYKRIEVEKSTDKGFGEEESAKFIDAPLDYRLDGVTL